MYIREAVETDLGDVLKVERLAFGEDAEANLVRDLLEDPTANPTLSLLAFEGEQAVGHILFSRICLEPESAFTASLLAPLAVVPDHQGKGIGGKLIAEGLSLLAGRGIGLVFVLGHPGYYPRHGFTPAGQVGFQAPYPIPEKDADAWMVQELVSGIIERVSGQVACAESLRKPEYWRE